MPSIMQTITSYIAIEGAASIYYRDYTNTKPQPVPELTRGLPVIFRVRVFNGRGAHDGSGTPYPITGSILESVTAWKFVLDYDFDQATTNVIAADHSEITLTSVQETGSDGRERTYTQFDIPISQMNSTVLAQLLGTSESYIPLVGELTGYDGNGDTLLVWQLPGIVVRNRIGVTGQPTDPQPDWLNAEQVRALVDANALPDYSEANAGDVCTLEEVDAEGGGTALAPKWKEPTGGAPVPILGTTDPTSATPGTAGQLYINTSTPRAFVCYGNGGTDAEPSYVWEAYIPTSARGAANGIAPLDANSKVPSANLQTATGSTKGVVSVTSSNGIYSRSGALETSKANDSEIDSRNQNFKPIVPSNLVYAVRSVSSNITTIPAATTAYSLLDASATTNSHSYTYTHAPTSAPTYTLPAVSSTTVLHEIILEVTFSANVLTYAFQDSAGNAITPLSTPDIQAGSVVVFLCRYSAAIGGWYIMPVPVGTAPAQS